jgi:uncharacterized protein
MQQRMDLVTLGVTDFARTREFYVEGLGWQPVLEVPGDVVFFQVGYGLLLSLFPADELAADGAGALGPGPAAMSLAQIVATEDEVVAALARAAAAGGRVLKPAQRAAFGGFHGYFADPSGFRWEVATNPGWSVDAAGQVTIVPITPGG